MLSCKKREYSRQAGRKQWYNQSLMQLPQITKILTDSDLDGIVSGAMLRIVFPDAQIIIGDPTGMQLGRYDDAVNGGTVIADLAYVEGCGMYFDHHESNRPEHSDFAGSWQPAPSAAEVVYNFFRNDFDLSAFSPLIPEVSKLDSALFTLAEYRQPSEVMRLGLVISRDDRAFNHLLIELLAVRSWDFVWQHELVQQKLVRAQEAADRIADYIHSNLKIHDGIGVIDMQNFAEDVRTSSFEFTSLYPDLDALMVFKPEREGFKVTFYSNSFNDDAFDYNLLAVAEEMNPASSGGHRGACGFVPRPGQTKTVVLIRRSLCWQSSVENN
ncbi:MAG: hypothetical protein TR69_WS6001000839 [candidate division WS6 bacterium OLB20]|uniref:DHHA1 domain protein n=1 Tax=candidate division WS6 bacterium OLB20 TaxID=1617426 RepID=A0A136LYT2_9BACT|nr:MAG: hypothetical protein TR69_WS6001000839 [candidate division WS6 bacterium OLB20]